MAIKGSLKEASLPDVIQLLALGNKTGCLAVADRQNFGYIYFEDGRITYASIVNRRDRLGDILVSSGRITTEQQQAALQRQEQFPDKKMGELLVELGVIEARELAEYIQLQIEEAVYFLFTWSAGTFNFESGVRPERQDLLVSINPESLLLEGARRVDEWSLIEKKIPSFDLVLSLDHDRLAEAGLALSPEQERLVPLVDGERDIHQLIEVSGLGEFDVGKGLYGLITAGFAHRVGSSAARAKPRVSDAKVEEHRNLGIAFYKTDMLEEALREFRRVAELRPAEGSASFYMGLIALKQARFEDAAAELRRSIERGGPRPAAVHNLAFAFERMGKLDEAEAQFGEAVTRAREDPRPMIGWATVALKRQDFDVALGRLARARELMGQETPPPIWYWASVLAHAANNDMEGATELGREAKAGYPEHPVLLNNLAVLLEVTGNALEAADLLQQAFNLEPTLPQISKNIGDLAYRTGNYDDAFGSYERAVKLNPGLGDDLYFKLGNIAFKRKDGAGARGYWERALELNSGHQLARANLDMLESQE